MGKRNSFTIKCNDCGTEVEIDNHKIDSWFGDIWFDIFIDGDLFIICDICGNEIQQY